MLYLGHFDFTLCSLQDVAQHKTYDVGSHSGPWLNVVVIEVGSATASESAAKGDACRMNDGHVTDLPWAS